MIFIYIIIILPVKDMVINCIHNKFLGPEGGTQLLHHNWGRIDSTRDWKSMFLLSMQRYISAKINAENNMQDVDLEYEGLMASLHNDLVKDSKNTKLSIFG